jgi:amino acid transporter
MPLHKITRTGDPTTDDVYPTEPSYLLSVVTNTLNLIMHMMMYTAAIRLRYSQPDLKRSYRVPGGPLECGASLVWGLRASLFPFWLDSPHRRSFRWGAQYSMLD